jgi:hypothetical protein
MFNSDDCTPVNAGLPHSGKNISPRKRKGNSAAFTHQIFLWLAQVNTDRKLPLCAIKVAICLASLFNEENGGAAWLGTEKIGIAIGRSKTTVIEGLGHLEARGHLRIQPGKQGRGNSGHYWMIPKGNPSLPFKDEEKVGFRVPKGNPGRHESSILESPSSKSAALDIEEETPSPNLSAVAKPKLSKGVGEETKEGTPSLAPFHLAKPNGKEAREEEEERERLDRLERRCRRTAGLENDPAIGLNDLSPILGLIARGFTESKIDAGIANVANRPNAPRRISSWKYYVGAIEEVKRTGSGQRTARPVPNDKYQYCYWRINREWPFVEPYCPDPRSHDYPRALLEQFSKLTDEECRALLREPPPLPQYHHVDGIT